MLTAVALIVGAIVAWLALDQLLITLKERREHGGASWHGHGPGTTFHSTGFEDTVPPHELAEQRHHEGGARDPDAAERTVAGRARLRGAVFSEEQPVEVL